MPSLRNVTTQKEMTTMIVHGGYGNYGMALGILMLDSKFARIPGDVGNATTYDFPVVFKIIDGFELKCHFGNAQLVTILSTCIF